MRHSPHRRAGATIALSLAAVLLPMTIGSTRLARADVLDRCVDTSERGQRARRATKLLEARQLFLACAAASCPGAIRGACSDWLSAVDASIPSLVIGVQGEAGDLPAARVLLDDQAVAQGAAVLVDPGAHRITASADGFASTSIAVVAHEGELRRAIRMKLAPSSTRSSGSAPTPAPPMTPMTPLSPSESGSLPPLRIASLVTGALALGALGSFTYFGVTARNDASDLRATCAPTCDVSARDEIRERYTIADVSLGAAIVLAGTSIVLWIAAAR